jgi:hypothetical protein
MAMKKSMGGGKLKIKGDLTGKKGSAPKRLNK